MNFPSAPQPKSNLEAFSKDMLYHKSPLKPFWQFSGTRFELYTHIYNLEQDPTFLQNHKMIVVCADGTARIVYDDLDNCLDCQYLSDNPDEYQSRSGAIH